MFNSKSSNVDGKIEGTNSKLMDLKYKLKKDFGEFGVTDAKMHASQSTLRSSFMNCVVIGHPFLSYRIEVTKAFLNKYKLTLDRIYWMDYGDKSILNDALTTFPDDIDIAAGGETLNIALAAQMMCVQPKSFVTLGVKSADSESLLLGKLLKDSQLSFKFEERKLAKTNIILVLTLKKRWCEIYYFDANCTFGPGYLDNPMITKILERANILFSTDNSIYMMPASVRKLAYYSSISFKLFCLSLYNVNIILKVKDDLKTILANTDVLFLTKECARTIIKIFKIPVNRVCLQMNKQLPRYIGSWLKTFSKKTCMVIISDGLRAVYLTIDVQANLIGKFHSRYYKETTIVDMFGTHEAFIAGFLSMLIQGYPAELCLDYGFLCTSMVAGQNGLRFPDNHVQRIEEWYDRHVISCSDINRQYVGNVAFTLYHTPWKLQDLDAGGTCVSSVTDTF